MNGENKSHFFLKWIQGREERCDWRGEIGVKRR